MEHLTSLLYSINSSSIFFNLIIVLICLLSGLVSVIAYVNDIDMIAPRTDLKRWPQY